MNVACEQIITLKPRILRLLLEQCLLQESIEVQINKQEQIFSTRIIDYLPELVQNMDEKDLSTLKPYDPFSFLKQGRCLLLEPLVSDKAEAQINGGDHLLIRFFTGYNTFEASVPFERFIMAEGKLAAVQAGYPLQLKVVHTRKHLRVKAMINSAIKVSIVLQSGLSTESPIIDLSTGGLSFCARFPPGLLSINKKVKLIVSVLDEKDLSLDAYIRHCTVPHVCNCCSDKAACDAEVGPQKTICGAEFVFLDLSQEVRINELIFLMQREYLINEKESLIKFNQDLEIKVKEKTNQLREKDIQLLEMDRIAGIATLASGLAHEINNPLSFVKSQISFVKKGLGKIVETAKYWNDKPVPEPLLKDYKEYLIQINFDNLTTSLDEKFDRIKKGIERIGQIIKSLKSFSSVDREDMNEIDINKSIEEAIEILRSQELENVEFVMELQEVPLMECSVNDINHCLFQTIQNAIDAVENSGLIKVISSYDKKKKQVMITIIDNGKGMTPEILRQAFNPFFTTKPVGSGTGVGLSMIERMIKRHGGAIELSSKENLGTTLTMRFPIISPLVRKIAILEGFDLQ